MAADRRSPPPGGTRVLNALRRHCGWRSEDFAFNLAIKKVLNALRRHCGWRIRNLPRTSLMNWCSTPCGVTAVGGVCDRINVSLFRVVLNALRRHCGWRGNASANGIAFGKWCSTPCGVTAVGGRRSHRFRLKRFACAQRLAASLRLAGHVFPAAGSNDLVLNALRRHCGWRTLSVQLW